MIPWLGLLGVAVNTISFIRVNQVGYLPDAPKVAVVCSLAEVNLQTFSVTNGDGRVVLRNRRALRSPGFGPCVVTHRLDFSSIRAPGVYFIVAGDAEPVTVKIGARVYEGGADTLLYYMRQQRSGWNPFFKDSVHRHEGNAVDDSGR